MTRGTDAPHGAGEAGDATAIPRRPRTRDRARAGTSGTGTRRATGALVSSVRPSVRPSLDDDARGRGEVAVGKMRRDARRGRGGAAVAAWALAWTLAACFAGEA